MSKSLWEQQYLGSWNREDSPVVFLNDELRRLRELGYEERYVRALSRLEWSTPGRDDRKFVNRGDDIEIDIEHIFRLKQRASADTGEQGAQRK